jgi:hypothetical protein
MTCFHSLDAADAATIAEDARRAALRTELAARCTACRTVVTDLDLLTELLLAEQTALPPDLIDLEHAIAEAQRLRDELIAFATAWDAAVAALRAAADAP